MRSSIIFFIAIATLLISFVHAHGTKNKDAVSAGQPSSGRAKLMRKRGPGGRSSGGGGSGRGSSSPSSGGNSKPAGSSSGGGGIGGGLLGSLGGNLLGSVL